jgi:DNA end-binding protein Ku
MKQAVWTGAIAFGLVTIPVRLYPATEPKDVRFHLYDRRSGKRVRYERVVREEEPAAFLPDATDEDVDTPDIDDQRDVDDAHDDGADEPEPIARGRPTFEIPPTRSVQNWPGVRVPEPEERVGASDIVRGYALPSGDLVTVSDDELELIRPSRSRTIEIEEFVELAEIDPVFFEKTYYVAPTRGVTEKPYALLLRAMQSAGMVAIGRFVLRTRPHLVAIRPLENALALETLYFGDEVRDANEVVRLPADVPSERELKTAQQLIRALATEWVPEKHADDYREELLDLLRRKSPATPAEHTEIAKSSAVDDLMAALKASVEAAKKRSTIAGGKQQRALAARTKRAR